MKNRFNVYPLWVLAQVQRFGSISKAADELEITQPAVSAQLKLLEQTYGKLYNRASRGVILTEHGRQLLERAESIFSQLEQIDGLSSAAQGSMRGRIRLGASTIPGAYLLPKPIAHFKATEPGVEINIKVASSLATLQALLDDTLSFAVIGEIYGRLVQGPLHWEAWQEDSLALFSHPESPVQDENLSWPERLGSTCLLLREKGSSTRAVAEEMLRPWLPELQSILELGSTDAIREWVLANLGVAVLSSLAVEREVASGLLKAVALPHGNRSRPFFMVRRKDRTLAPVEEALWKALQEHSVPKMI